MSDVDVSFGAETGSINADLAKLGDDFERLFNSAGAEAQEAARDIQRSMERIRRSVQDAGSGIGGSNGLVGMIGGLKGQLAGLAIGAGLAALAKETVETITEFERLRAVLTTLEGEQVAGARFEQLKKFATETPYDLAQVVTAFSKLKAMGLDPGEQALKSYGNTAAGMGKSLDQFIEAVADAVTGENERLKEFGIKASVNGDKVTYTFKGISTTVKNTSQEIQNYLQSIGNKDFAGAMDRQMKTLGGAFSNLGDAVHTAMDDIGKGGLAEAIAGVVREISTATSETGNWATALGEGLGVAVTEVWEIIKVFSGAVGDILGTVADVIRDLTGTTASNGDMMKNTWKAVEGTIVFFGYVIKVTLLAAKAIVQEVAVGFYYFAQAVSAALRFDGSGFLASMRTWGSEVTKISQDTANKIMAETDKTNKRLIKLQTPDKAPDKKPAALPGYTAPPATTKPPKEKKESSADKMSKWREELQARIQSEAGFYKDSTALEIDFWNSKLSQAKKGSSEYRQIENQLFQLRKKQAGDQLSDQLAALEQQQRAAKDDFTARMRIEDEKLALLARTYGEDSRQYRDALAEKRNLDREYAQFVMQIERENVQNRAQIASTVLDSEAEVASMRLQRERDVLDQKLNAGLVSRGQYNAAMTALDMQEVTAEAAHETALFNLKMQSVRSQLALQNLPAADRRRLHNELEQLEAEHQGRMAVIQQKSSDAIVGSQRRVADATRQRWTSVIAPVGQAFDGFVQSMWMRTATFNDGIRQIGTQIVSSFLSMGVQMLTNWATMEAAKTGATAAGAATRVGVEATAAATSDGIAAASGIKQIAISAAKAAAGAYAAIASIPVVGPVLAPAAAAAALYGVYQLGKGIFSAEDGMGSVPFDNAPFLLHKNEMVLPADIANPLRNSLRGAGPRSGGVAASTAAALQGSTVRDTSESLGGMSLGDMHLNFQSIDPVTGAKWMMNNRGALVRAMKQAIREGVKIDS